VKKSFLFFLVIISASVAVLARLKFNGLVYGFDYGIYQPDGVDYSYKTLEFIGENPSQIATQVSAWYSENSLKMTGITPQDVAQGQLTFPQSRIIYPLLSAPFVRLIGLPGMLVIPVISFFVLQFSILTLGVKLKKLGLAASIALAISMSPTVLRWMISDCADSLFVALISLFPILLTVKNLVVQRILMILLVIAATFTRFSLPIFLAIAIVLLLKRKFLLAGLILVTSLVANIPALTQSSSMLLPQSDLSFLNKLISLPVSALKVGFIEVAELAVLDRLLLLVLILSFVLAAKNYKTDSSMYFFAVLLSVWALGAVNGTLGVNFRYQLPLVIFCCWVLMENSPKFSLISSVHIESKEAQK
jgi:hypothetical protein